MEILVATFIVIGLAMIAMAVGALFAGKPLPRSCGGAVDDVCWCGAGPGEACRNEEEVSSS